MGEIDVTDRLSYHFENFYVKIPFFFKYPTVSVDLQICNFTCKFICRFTTLFFNGESGSLWTLCVIFSLECSKKQASLFYAPLYI